MSQDFMPSGRARVAGVMGWPVGHSLSPRLHGYWLRQYAIDGVYVPLAVPPDRLEQALRALPSLGFRGVNLTVPHKQAALSFVDRTDSTARRVGAINTILVGENGQLEGLNTDVYGFAENLRAVGLDPKTLPSKTAAVLGAGGAARAVVAALQDMGFAEVRIVNRSRERAERLIETLGGKLRFVEKTRTNEALENASLLVNATSLGMTGEPPLSIDLAALPKEAWVADAVYTPLMTGLLRQASARGNRIVDGLGMLLHQARPAFAAWFGVEPEVTEALRRHVMGVA